MTYNYQRFDDYVEQGEDTTAFGGFAGRLHVGEFAPDLSAVCLDDGQTERVSDRWRRRTVVMEFGSFT